MSPTPLGGIDVPEILELTAKVFLTSAAIEVNGRTDEVKAMFGGEKEFREQVLIAALLWFAHTLATRERASAYWKFKTEANKGSRGVR